MSINAEQDRTASFANLLQAAITEPGKIHAAYFAFHGYSIGNQILALIQCAERGIAPGPIASFNKWKERGRFVQKGQKAIALWMPITCKRTVEQEGGNSEEIAFMRFLLKRNWFVLSQTQGQDYAPEQIPNWDRTRALQTLGIEQIAFDHTDGNVWGFARGKQIGVSPLSPMPDRTLLHEIAHVVLGHTAEHIEQDGPLTPRNIREVEAEGVALLCSAALGLDGAKYSRGYLQHWLRGDEIPERSCQRIFKAADAILRAGRETAEEAL
jgi:N-terminal domain of anti-restriction factor ArdC/IrrE N-terminal-like domain